MESLVSHIRSSVLILLLFLSVPANSAVIDITAEYRPDITDPGNLTFKNTTPVRGFCTVYPHLCPEGSFSVYSSDILIKKRLNTVGGNDRINLLGVQLDAGKRETELTNSLTGQKIKAHFRLNLIDLAVRGRPVALFWAEVYGGCSSRHGIPHTDVYTVAWVYPEGNRYCNKRYFGEQTIDQVYDIEGVGLGYELDVDSPKGLDSGQYTGEIVYSLGSGGDIDYYAESYSDDEIRFRITATIQHAFDLQFPAESNQVNLEPMGGWGAWLNYGRTPARLERNVQFILTTSNPVNISLQCQYLVGSQCGLSNRDSGDLLALETRLTLPGLDAEDGSNAQEVLLTTEVAGQTFTPDQYVHKRNAQVHFRVNKHEVDTMLKQPGSRWRGQVTLVFDASGL